MPQSIQKLTIEGFKSIRKLTDFELGPLNVLIGANGAGKSNFVDFFRLVRAMADENLAGFVNKQGGADGFFHQGPKMTSKITARLRFATNEYAFELEPTANNELIIAGEFLYDINGNLLILNASGFNSRGQKESGIRRMRYPDNGCVGVGPDASGSAVYDAISNWTVYHFHDTSALAPMRRDQSARDTDYLRPDASNIAAYLLALRDKKPEVYELIRDTIRVIAPFFDDFRLRAEERGGQEAVRLEWTQKGSDFPFQPSQFSDGTIRFICLATALLQPLPPATIVIDEPELGLHPHALEILAGLLRKASARMQVIVSTQSAPLLNQFNPEDVVVVDRKGGASEFVRLDAAHLAEWLKTYTLGELWQKNYLDGGPAHD